MKQLLSILAGAFFVAIAANSQTSQRGQVDRAEKPGYIYKTPTPVKIQGEPENLPGSNLGMGGGFNKVTEGPPVASRYGVSERPTVMELKPLYEKSGQALPALLAVLAEHNDLYLVTFGVHIIQERGEKFKRFAFRATYLDSDVTTIELFPATEWKTRFKLGFKGKVAITPTLEFFPKIVGTSKKNVSFTILFDFGYEWKYPVIQAIGKQDSFCEWLYDAKRKELVGDIPLYAIVLTPKVTPNARIVMGAAFIIDVDKKGKFQYKSGAEGRLAFVPSLTPPLTQSSK